MAQFFLGLLLIAFAAVIAFYGQQIARDGWTKMHPSSSAATDSTSTNPMKAEIGSVSSVNQAGGVTTGIINGNVIISSPTVSAETQAAQVSGWATVIKHGSPHQSNQITYEIKIKNSSDQPIYEVEATLYIDKTEKRGPENFHIVPAGEIATSTMVTSWPLNTVKGLVGYIDYKFRDSRGQNWHRDFNGNLNSIR